MSKLKIKFWGVRGSIPVSGRKFVKYGGNTSCIEISFGKNIIICDAGTGIRELGNHLLNQFGRRKIASSIILSHVHWDHYMGLPFFRPIYKKQNSFTVMGPAPVGIEFGEALQNAIRPPYFPISISEVHSHIDFKTISGIFHTGGVEIVPLSMNHPQGALGWRFNFKNNKSIVLVTDNEPGQIDEMKLIEWMKGAELLIHDSQYFPEQYIKKIGWGHSPFTYPIRLAADAAVKRVVLTHFDPDSDDRTLDKMQRLARLELKKLSSKTKCLLAREGLELQL